MATVSREVLASGETRALTYGITDEQAGTVGLPCGGEIDVTIERISLSELEDFAEEAPHRLLVFGAVDIAESLCRAANELGWQTVVADPRAKFATRDRIASADELLVEWPEEVLAQVEPDERTAVVVLTHEERFDLPALLGALRSDAFYVGAIGSRRTQESRRERLLGEGLSEAECDRLSGPTGLDLGAETPAETAVSILAEILAVRAGRSGGRLKRRLGPHPRRTPAKIASWRRSSASSTTIPSTATRRRTRVTASLRSTGYHGGQTTPTPQAIDFTPGELLGSVSGELGLRSFIEGRGHTLIVTSDKEGPDSAFERELPDAEIVISQPFWPAYLTAERIAKAPNLKLAVTAGIGSDHVDLQAAIDNEITVAEVTYSNSISVSEHVVMMILALVRNYLPSYQIVVEGGWNIADAVSRSYDLEGMQVGTVGAGRIGSAVLRRLKPFEVGLHYTDRHRLPADGRAGARSHLPRDSRGARRRLRRRHDQRAAPSRDRASLRRRHDRPHEARRLSGEHGPREDLRSRRGRGRVRERPARGLRRRRLVPAACAAGSPVADDAAPRHDAAHLGLESLGAGPLRGGDARDPRMLVRRPPDPRGVPDRRSRPSRRSRRALVQRGRRNRRLGRSGPFHVRLTAEPALSDDLLNVWDYERAAEERLEPGSFGYFAGGANDEWTMRENRAAFERWVLRPRMLVDVSEVTTATSVLGTDVSMPLLVAPTAFQRMAHPDGELAMARGAAAAGTVMCLSTLATATIEEVAEASADGARWFQLYWSSDRGVVQDLLDRAAANGFTALVLTVDLPELGRRERDLRTGFEIPEGDPGADLPRARRERRRDLSRRTSTGRSTGR